MTRLRFGGRDRRRLLELLFAEAMESGDVVLLRRLWRVARREPALAGALAAAVRRYDDEERAAAEVIHVVWAEGWGECGAEGAACDGGTARTYAEALPLAAALASDMAGLPGRVYLTDGAGRELDLSKAWGEGRAVR